MLERLNAGWSRVEVALITTVTAALSGSLVTWVALKGLSSKTTDTFFAGLVFRGLVGALALGLVARVTTRRLRRSAQFTLAAAVVGAALAPLWRDAGVDWATNVLAWLQDGSTLTLVGGLRGLGTRLTLWLALLGASLATAQGRHVTIDVASRALPPTWQPWLSRAGGVVAAAVCLVSAWGFFDFTAVDAFEAPPTAPAGEKIHRVAHGLSRHAFLVHRQIALDATVVSRVVTQSRWDTTLTTTEWNEWLEGAHDGWLAHYDQATFDALHENSSEFNQRRAPLVSTPREATRGLVVKSLNLVVPFGLVMVALRFVLWVLRGAKSANAHEAPAP